MSNVITLRVPESLYARAKKLAKDDGISLNQYVQMALNEKLAREETMQLVEGRFKKLEDDLRELIVTREILFQQMFQKENKILNNRYSNLNKPLRRGGS